MLAGSLGCLCKGRSLSAVGTVRVQQAAIFVSHGWMNSEPREGFASLLLPVVSFISGWRPLRTRRYAQWNHSSSNRFKFSSRLLDEGRLSLNQALSCADSHVHVVRSFGRGSSFRRMTCGLLEKFFPDLKSSRLILAKDDPDLDVYKTNAGPWASRIIMGVKGAERQIAFIDQIAPKGRGTWLTQMIQALANARV